MKTKPDYLESQEFYDLMQCYRIADMMDQENVIKRFEAVKDFIREKSVAPEMLEALNTIYGLISSGDLVRNISKDDNFLDFTNQAIKINNAIVSINEAIQKSTS